MLQIYTRLKQCSATPDFNNYLVYILGLATVSYALLGQSEAQSTDGIGNSQDKPLEVRQSAGLLLKNNLRSSWGTQSPQVQQYVKASGLSASVAL